MNKIKIRVEGTVRVEYTALELFELKRGHAFFLSQNVPVLIVYDHENQKASAFQLDSDQESSVFTSLMTLSVQDFNRKIFAVPFFEVALKELENEDPESFASFMGEFFVVDQSGYDLGVSHG